MRGCVRVTGLGVEAVVEGCHNLEVFDVSQCKNLSRWIDEGGVERCRWGWAGLMGMGPGGGAARGGKELKFEVVAGDLRDHGWGERGLRSGEAEWMRCGSARL